MITAFIPILLLLLILFIVFSGIKKATQKASFINSQRIKWILGGYVAILIASVFITYFLPIEEYTGAVDTDREISIDEVDELINQFYSARNQQDFENIEGIFVADEWSFAFDGKSLNLKKVDYAYSGMFLYVEEKANEDGKVEVIRYSTPHIVQRWDVTHLGGSPHLDLQGNSLLIYPPERTRIELATFHKEFTITQFTGEKMFMDGFGSIGVSMFYLKVPANVQIKHDETISIHYVTP